MRKYYLYIFMVSALVAGTKNWAQVSEEPNLGNASFSEPNDTPPNPGEKTGSKSRSFEIEGDTIEASRTRPEVFFDVQSSPIDLDDVIYTRTNFDDYFKSDMQLRPGFAK